jgi:mannose-1-phosphate guanylyltransferase/mannose-6-phosphate isomerase
MDFIPVILSGGAGSRLWPRSRELTPKQLISHDGGLSLLQKTAARLANLPEATGPIVVCNLQHCPQVVAQLSECGIQPHRIIEEHSGRNTGPAIAAAAILARENGGDPVLLIAPADHLIDDDVSFKEAVMTALPLAEDGWLVTLGVEPDRPHTGFGYIRLGDELRLDSYRVAEFVEKPSLAVAQQYVESRNYLWNSGMLMARASVIVHQMRIHAPDLIATATAAMEMAARQANLVTLKPDAFADAPAVAFDYAVLEHANPVAVVPLRAQWNDLGSWSAMWETGRSDDCGNVLQGDVVAVNSRNSLVSAESRLVATAGVEDIIVVETPDAVLVANRQNAEDVKAVVSELKQNGRSETVTGHRVNRPWGSYEVLDSKANHQVKRLIVNPGSRLSLQRHQHRSEHWVVTKGVASARVGDRTVTLRPNESVHVPIGTKHRITNDGFVPLEIIEVQIGDYLGEDDIERIQDDFGRVS